MDQKSNCIFCKIDKNTWLAETDSWFAVPDKFPVTPGHALLIPKNHRLDYFELTSAEAQELNAIIHQVKNQISHSDPLVNGYNIGANCGSSAGQTVFHCHIHLIPRRSLDVSSPEGGVRGVIPDKKTY